MELPCSVEIDPSAFPHQMEKVMQMALEQKSIPPALLYKSDYQAMRWMALHKAYSPTHQSRNVLDLYSQAFKSLGGYVRDNPYVLTSIGCGGGFKEEEFFKTSPALPDACRLLDISPWLATTSWFNIRKFLTPKAHVIDIENLVQIPGFVGDVMNSQNLRQVHFFFGMLPNIAPETAWNLLNGWTKPGDIVVLSANLASQSEWTAGLPGILPQYDNHLTRLWISAFLENLGIFHYHDKMDFHLRESQFCDQKLISICASAKLDDIHTIEFPGIKPVTWLENSEIHLFSSTRYSSNAIIQLSDRFSFSLLNSFIDPGEEEGVFILERRKAD